MNPRRDERGRSDEGPVPVSAVLSELGRRMGMAGSDVLGAIFVRWQDIVGASIAAHVKPIQLRDRTLVVGADHPAWATQMRHLTPEILEKLRAACGAQEAPERIEVRVRT
ncbi:MAG: DUF721 domain-containing protein [Acidimicrobiales bacterium]